MTPSPESQASIFSGYYAACSCAQNFMGVKPPCPIHDPPQKIVTTVACGDYTERDIAETKRDDRRFSATVSKKDTEPESVPEAIQRVYDNASDAWKTAASQIIYRLCETRHSFDLDDVAEALKPIDHLPHKPRAVGHLMKKARKDGWCRIIGYKKSQRDSRHHGVISEDESLIFSVSGQ